MMRNVMILGLGLALAACGAEAPIDGPTAYLNNCASCHGGDGRGNGPAARGLDVAPADLTQIAARNGGVFPRDAVMSKIDGYQIGAHPQRVMPEFGAGDLGETVIVENDGLGMPVPLKLLLLTDYLESIQG
jgi:mono/diheme cytochrome c family protein